MNAAENTERRSGRPLVLIFLLLAAGILTAGYVYYRSYERHFRTRIEHELSAVTELKVAQIVQWRRERLTDANYLKHTPYAARRSLDVLAQPASETTRKMFTSWLNSLLAGGSYEQVLLLDDKLKLGLAYPGRTPAALSGVALRAAQQALSLKQVVVADLHRETENGPVYLSIMVPLVVRRESTGDKVPAAGTGSLPGDRSAALLILQINANKEFHPLIQHWPTPSRTAETLLVRRDGNDVLFLTELKFQTNTALKFRIPLERTNVIAVKAALGQEGIVDGLDYRGVAVVAALRAIPDSSWSLVARMDLAEVYAPLRERLWQVVVLIVTLLFAAGAGVGLVWRQQRLRFYQERHTAAAELRESEKRFAGAFEHAPIGVALMRPDGRWLKVNRALCDLVGYSEAELLGRSFQDITHPADLAASLEMVRRMIGGELRSYQMEKHYVHQRGHLVTGLLSVSLVRDGQGQPHYFIIQIQDITERKRAEAELEKAHQELVEASRMAGMAEIATNVLHNVGNVLNSVNVSTGLIVEKVKKSRASGLARVAALLRDHAHDLGEFITRDAKGKHVPAHLAQLSEHLLADQATIVSELDSLRQNVEHIKEIVAMQQSYAKFGGVKEIINVVELVEDSLRMHEGALSRHGVEVIREFEPVPPMNVEKHKLLQILVNLLRNAKHACQDSDRADSRLTVRVANGAGRIKISVRDNGVGIPPENLNRIFNHGFTTRKGGHGFGLHSGALAATEMSGSLTAHSDGPGQGAIFTLELPCEPPRGITR